MKKFLAILCAAILMIATMATALANPSIADLSASIIEAVAVEELPEGVTLIAKAPDTSKYSNAAVAEVVDTVNGDGAVATVADVASKLGAAIEGINFADYDFITNFAEIDLETADEVKYDLDGEPVAAKVTMAIDALKGVEKEDLGSYKFLLINPIDANVALIDLDPDSFDAETGTITVEFPFLGVFALVQKVA